MARTSPARSSTTSCRTSGTPASARAGGRRPRQPVRADLRRISGSLPSGVTVAYSQSSNPCRPEVYPNAANSGCVNDWTTAAPTPLSPVRRSVHRDRYVYAAQSFAVNFTVQAPVGYVNTVAWNSAASDASYNGTPLLPAEPPKVGLTAAAPAVTPTLSTTASTSISRRAAHSPMRSSSATPAGRAGRWTGHSSGRSPRPRAARARVSIGPRRRPSTAARSPSPAMELCHAVVSPDRTGCYSYVEQLPGAVFAGPATSPAGSAAETVLVGAPADPTPPAAPAPPPGNGNADTQDPVAQSTPATPWLRRRAHGSRSSRPSTTR